MSASARDAGNRARPRRVGIGHPDDFQSDYIAEVKYDGYRVLAQFGDSSCTLRTRNGADCTKWFPEVSMALAEARHGRMVVDGEMCIRDAAGRSDFDSLHGRARRRRLSDGDVLVTFCAFDLLVFENRDVMAAAQPSHCQDARPR